MKEQIAANLEQAFSDYGFAETSVSKLKDASKVSLRTLYKYYPSKEAMVLASLYHRHQRYIHFLVKGVPESGRKSILFVFDNLELWMQQFAPHGCLSTQAIAAFPDNVEILDAVKAHKSEVRGLFFRCSQRQDLADALFLLHEGVSNSYSVMGNEIVLKAKETINKLME